MNIKCGTDIIEIDRIKDSIETYNNSFLEKIYTDKEIEYCESKKMQKFQHYTARFAAKEAVFKAISDNLENKYSISWKDIEILNDGNGRPYVAIKNQEQLMIENIDLSISHCKNYAVAMVIVVFSFRSPKF